MTIIEFFDRESHIENIVSALLCAPDKVIFLGDGKRKMDKISAIYEKIALNRGINVKFESKPINRNDLMSIVGAIEDVIAENEDCIIDLSGGDDLSLVAVGIVYADNADKIKLHRFKITSSTMLDCDSDGELCCSAPLELKVDEIVAINGGRIIYDDEKPNGTHKWNFSDEFADDIRAMWSICRQDPNKWNTQIGILCKLLTAQDTHEGLEINIDLQKANTVLMKWDKEKKIDFELYKKLAKYFIIEDFRLSANSMSFRFRNGQVKKCLTKSGQVFELFLALSAKELKDNDGNSYYTDVMSGAFIDWDGEIHTGTASDVENEIDLILMKGLMPVFISCKNGAVGVDELYKLSVVANKFGGKYVRKVLAATEIDKEEKNVEFIRIRADAMGIKPWIKLHKKGEEAFEDELKLLWKS